MEIRGNRLTRLIVVAFILVMTSAGNAFAKELTTTPQDQQTRSVADGEKVKKFRGIVVKREPDAFTMSDTMGGPLTSVLLTADTEVKSHKKGVFRGSKEYGASYILRGLRLEVDGVGNSAGQIVAEKIRFDEQDLRSAQALKSTVDPIEAEMNEKFKQQQAESERLAGQIEENRALTAQAQAQADAAAEAAKKAQQTADYANNRINGLDDFDSIKTITVNFASGSARREINGDCLYGIEIIQAVDAIVGIVRRLLCFLGCFRGCIRLRLRLRGQGPVLLDLTSESFRFRLLLLELFVHLRFDRIDRCLESLRRSEILLVEA